MKNLRVCELVNCRSLKKQGLGLGLGLRLGLGWGKIER